LGITIIDGTIVTLLVLLGNHVFRSIGGTSRGFSFSRGHIVGVVGGVVFSDIMVEFRDGIEFGGDEGGDGTRNDGEDEGEEETGELDTSLLTVGARSTVTSLEGGGSVVSGTSSDGDGSGEATDETGHTVEVVDTAGVEETNLVLEVGLDVLVTDGGDDTGDGSDEDGTSGLDAEGASSTNGDTTSESSVLKLDDVDVRSAVVSDDEGRDDIGGDDGSANTEEGVDEDTVLVGGVDGNGTSGEGGPVHEEEDGTDEGEEIGNGVGGVVGLIFFGGFTTVEN